MATPDGKLHARRLMAGIPRTVCLALLIAIGARSSLHAQSDAIGTGVAPPLSNPTPAEATSLPQTAPVTQQAPTAAVPLPETWQSSGYGSALAPGHGPIVYDPAGAIASPPPVCPWYHLTGQLMWLHRTEADRNQAIVLATTPTATTVALGMDNLNLPIEAGIRASVLLGYAGACQWELSYLGVFDQEGRAEINIDPATTGVTQTTQLFFGAANTSLTNFQYTSVYESDLHSPELTFWLADDDWRFRPMIGARWIEQTDRFHVFESPTPGTGGSAEFSNQLIGAQLGFQTVLWQRAEWFRVQAMAKAGVYANEMDLTASVSTLGVPAATLDRSFSSTSYSGEINVTAMWQLTPHLNFHVGYTGLWLTEVGSVGDQNDDFDVLAGTGSVDLGGISYQGGHLGVTFSW